MILKEYNYINDIGWPKKIVISVPENKKYDITIWDRRYGEYCGSGQKTKKELNDFLKHYGLPTIP